MEASAGRNDRCDERPREGYSSVWRLLPLGRIRTPEASHPVQSLGRGRARLGDIARAARGAIRCASDRLCHRHAYLSSILRLFRTTAPMHGPAMGRRRRQ